MGRGKLASYDAPDQVTGVCNNTTPNLLNTSLVTSRELVEQRT